MHRFLPIALGSVLTGCVIPLPSGIDYTAEALVRSAADGGLVEGARARIVGIRLPRPYTAPFPATCDELVRVDSLRPIPFGTTVLSADTTGAAGRFAVAVRRRWVIPPGATDVHWPEEYEWRRLEVEAEGYAPYRAVVVAGCPGSLAPPQVIELVPEG